MTGTYANKEQANRWMNEMMAQVQGETIPRQIAGGALANLQYMPDTIEELFMSFLERSGPLGALIGGGLGYGIHGAESLVKNLLGFATGGIGPGILSSGSLESIQEMFSGMFRAGGGVVDALKGLSLPGDVPEPGIGDMEWSGFGTASTAGLHPDLRKKVKSMMRANPKIRVTSGLRDTATQESLRSKGYNKVSGKPSAHTRGLAADLGPSSQYGWIVKNARKFGLSSGNRHGEPWHVGMGDVESFAGPQSLRSFRKQFGIGDTEGAPPKPSDYAAVVAAAKTRARVTDSSGIYPDAGAVVQNVINETSDFDKWYNDDYEDAGYWISRATIEVKNAQTAGDTTGAFPEDTPAVPIPPVPAGPATTPVAPPASPVTPSSGVPNVPAGGFDSPGQGLGALFNLFTGRFSKTDSINAIGGLIPTIMNLFMGAFGMGQESDLSPLEFDPGLYSALRGNRTYTLGGLLGGGPTQSFQYGAGFSGGNAPGYTGGGGGKTGGSSTSKTLAGALKDLGVPTEGLSAGTMVAHLAHAAGFPNDAIDDVVGIAKRESGWDPSRTNFNERTKDQSYGLMQINMRGNLGPARRAEYGITSNDELLEPLTNLEAAFKLSSSGTSFYHWGGYKGESDTYGTNMNEARRIARDAGYGDMPENYAEVNSMFTGRPDPGGMTFHNTFVINAPNGSPATGGIDVRRTVGILAEHLEQEMKSRTMRFN